MKYFNPSYWFKLWVLSIPLFNDKTQGINAMSIDNNQKIKNWANNNTTNLDLMSKQLNLSNNNQTNFINYQNYSNIQPLNNNFNEPHYQAIDFQQIPHKHHHEKNKNRHKKCISQWGGLLVGKECCTIFQIWNSGNWNGITYGSVIDDPLWHTYLHISYRKWWLLKNYYSYQQIKDFFLSLSNYDYVADTLVNIIKNNEKWINEVYIILNPNNNRCANYRNGLRIHIKGYINNAQLINVSPQCTECNDNAKTKTISYVMRNRDLNEIKNNEIDEILTKIKSQNSNLDISKIYISNISKNSAKIVAKSNSDYADSSYVTFSIQNTIKFLGLKDEYKGGIGIDTANKKIIFSQNNNYFHVYFDGSSSLGQKYNEITIYNNFDKNIKKIIINGKDTMKEVISRYNLANGINYQDGYLINIFSAEPQRTLFYEQNEWRILIKNYIYSTNKNETLFILDNKISSFDFMKNEFHLINDWNNKINNWKKE
ncbi:putative mucin/carbohydrate-binding domain-containing protein [Spiroplasma endosymbiont of Polydrusus pterygomalis]|uniref:putative mucin/carbohydrate-binding domain-containing protein n=1 Tax=Spiroplasma endosymbiont of Polydrusus pterygomalis TaxID=3139327 RepID=UPI003CCB0AB6